MKESSNQKTSNGGSKSQQKVPKGRKTRGKWGDLVEELYSVDAQRFRYGVRRVKPFLKPETAQTRITRLGHLLTAFAQDKPRAYSFILQSWLALLGIRYPRGVFKHDYSVPERGRRTTDLGVRALRSRRHGFFRPRHVSWWQTAQELLPEDHRRNPQEATKRVKRAAQSAVAHWKEIRRTLSIVRLLVNTAQERIDFSPISGVDFYQRGTHQTPIQLLLEMAASLKKDKIVR